MEWWSVGGMEIWSGERWACVGDFFPRTPQTGQTGQALPDGRRIESRV
ncbi:MAG: hypothetical protein ACYC6P_11385 [Ignavibacteriaceae bacterium]